jgi:hypothetical protein
LPEIFSLDLGSKPKIVIDKFLLTAHVMTEKKPCSCIKKKEVSCHINPFATMIPHQVADYRRFSHDIPAKKKTLINPPMSQINFGTGDAFTLPMDSMANIDIEMESMRRVPFSSTRTEPGNHKPGLPTPTRSFQEPVPGVHAKRNTLSVNELPDTISTKFVPGHDNDALSMYSAPGNANNLIKQEFTPQYNFAKAPVPTQIEPNTNDFNPFSEGPNSEIHTSLRRMMETLKENERQHKLERGLHPEDDPFAFEVIPRNSETKDEPNTPKFSKIAIGKSDNLKFDQRGATSTRTGSELSVGSDKKFVFN